MGVIASKLTLCSLVMIVFDIEVGDEATARMRTRNNGYREQQPPQHSDGEPARYHIIYHFRAECTMYHTGNTLKLCNDLMSHSVERPGDPHAYKVGQIITI